MLEYKPHFIPSAIYIVGCGGTGSRLVPLVAQMVKTVVRATNPRGWVESLPILLIDDDKVEDKNLIRQNFIQQDVGQYKSVVLATRYGRGFGIPIYASVQRIEPGTSKLNFLGTSEMFVQPTSNVIVILAVDSPAARKDVLQRFFYNCSNIFVLDAGNEDTFGQVRFFTDRFFYAGDNYDSPADIDRRQKDFKTNFPKLVPSVYPVNYIPFPVDHYTNLGTSASEKSCADLDQTLAINAMMAVLMSTVLQNFLYVKPMTYHQISYNLNGAVTTTFNTVDTWFNQYLSRTVKYPASFLPRTSLPIFVDVAAAEDKRYRFATVQSLNTMGLVVGEGGVVTPKPAPVKVAEVVVEEAPKPKKAARKKVESVVVDGPIVSPAVATAASTAVWPTIRTTAVTSTTSTGI